MPNVKPVLPPLKTPKSASFPSELHDDSASSVSDSIKREDSATPITPGSAIPLPKAYTEFLEAMTPVFSPASAGASFKFPLEKSSASPTSQPASALGSSFAFSPLSTRSPMSARSPTISLPPLSSLPPPTPASAAPSRKSFAVPRRLRIPQELKYSPYSPSADSPKSATSLRSPYSANDWKLRYHEPPRSATGKPVSVKQVVTRTVTYKRTQLEAPPKGKRRKCREVKEIKQAKEV